MPMKHLLNRCRAALAIALVCLIGASCTDTETTDKTSFVIYYSGLTDIGPSMEGIVSSPTYKGATPSEFAITAISLKGEPYTGSGFSIHPDNGAISVSNTKDLPVGLYRISVSCQSGGKTHQFDNVAEVNMMAPVPDGIKVEPNKLTADYADIIDAASTVQLPTAQVTTEGEHVSISKYEIADGEYKRFFAITPSGEISIVKGSADILPGKYVLNLKLTTKAGEGIFENALEVNVTSKPLSLTYAPATGKVEEETMGGSTFAGNAPLLKGSTDEVVYSIAAVTPATDKIGIDAQTGALSVAAGHGFKAGQRYVVDVKVANAYAPEGVTFASAFAIEVVSFIEPVANLAYDNATRTQATAFELKHTPTFVGDEASFEFVDLDAALQGQLAIDHEGTITARKGNTLALGNHTLKVKASNSKNAVTTSFTLTIKENENFFTYIRYGNNLGLPVEGNAYQYRAYSADELEALDIPAPTTDLRAGAKVTWSVQAIHQMKGITITETGVLKPAKGGWKDAQCGLVMVTATAGEGEEAVSVSVPVFFHCAAAINGVSVEYSPFVLQADPKKQTRSVTPKLVGVTDASLFLMDYRRTFNYYNINGNHVNGQPSVSGSFLQGLWDRYFETAGGSLNYSSKNPMSYYVNEKDLSQALAYVDKDGSVVVNPNKWTDGEYANGAFIGQMTFTTDGNVDYLNNSKNTNQVFPIFIYLQ
ncbi:MAG: DUF4958 domain-containing protein [Bacteroides sp.]|nr:DUF4958 domain-containing protein [Bacteroides sp.]